MNFDTALPTFRLERGTAIAQTDLSNAAAVTLEFLGGDKQMRVGHERNLRYDDLSVADVMTELASLDAVDYARMRTATVGNAVATLRRLGRNHMLVVEAATAETPRRVRGVVSVSQIERQLGSRLDVVPIANSFSEIERALV